MKIGIVGPIWLDIPPKTYGGTEEVVYNLVNGLVDRGHDVTLFGPKTAKVKSRVFATVERPLRDDNIDWTNVPYTLNHISSAFDKVSEFDILHMHLNKSQDFLSLPLAIYSKVPVVFTLHFMVPTLFDRKDRYIVLNKYSKLPFTSISNSQRDGIDLNFVATVYNGLNIEHFPFQEKPQEYFAWIGKVNPVKGTKEAILAAKKANVKLFVMGAVDSGVKHMLDYYEKEVKPLIDGKNIVWVGEVGIKEKANILGGAKALLNPILWEEPFGLVMAEAQAVGTPVISFRRGAAPELIADGKTGFLVDTLDEMVERIKQVSMIDRHECRLRVEQRFTRMKMVEGYEQAYALCIQHWTKYISHQKKQLDEMSAG